MFIKKMGTLVLSSVMLFHSMAVAQQGQPQPEPKKHHKALGIALIVVGAVVTGVGAVVLSRPCPVQNRAAQETATSGINITTSVCGSSFLQNNKTAIGAPSIGIGGGLIVARHSAGHPVSS